MLKINDANPRGRRGFVLLPLLAIESTEHEVAEDEGSISVDMGDLSLGLNAGSTEAGDVHVCIEVERVGTSNVQRYRKKISKC